MSKSVHVKLYRCYAADQRLSMDIFASQLAASVVQPGWQVSDYQPRSKLERWATSRWLMRYLRYSVYPRRVANLQADIHHVVDHGYAHLLPRLLGGSTVLTIHDLIPLLAHLGEIESAGASRRPWLNEYSLSFAVNYDRVTVPSKQTASDVQKYLGVPAERIEVIPPVIAEHFQPLDDAHRASFAKRYELDSQSRWLMVSGQEFYKNHESSLQVLKQLRGQGYPLRLLKTGVPTADFTRLVERHQLQESVTEVYLQNADELPLAYNFVDCLLFPSLYEGFGMPVAEALACGTPVVASNRGSLPEIGDDLVVRSSPFDVQALSKATALILDRPTNRAAYARAAQEFVQHYRPAVVGQQWRTLYQSLND